MTGNPLAALKEANCSHVVMLCCVFITLYFLSLSLFLLGFFFRCSVKLVLIPTHEFCLLFPDSHPHPTVLVEG